LTFVLRATVVVLVVLLGLFAIGDAIRFGSSYPTAVLAVVAAIVAMITLFTAPDSKRLHDQLDLLYQELHTIRTPDAKRLHDQLDLLYQELHTIRVLPAQAGASVARPCGKQSLSKKGIVTTIAATVLAIIFLRRRRDSKGG